MIFFVEVKVKIIKLVARPAIFQLPNRRKCAKRVAQNMQDWQRGVQHEGFCQQIRRAESVQEPFQRSWLQWETFEPTAIQIGAAEFEEDSRAPILEFSAWDSLLRGTACTRFRSGHQLIFVSVFFSFLPSAGRPRDAQILLVLLLLGTCCQNLLFLLLFLLKTF